MKCIVLKKYNINLAIGMLASVLVLIILLFSSAVRAVTAKDNNRPITSVKTEEKKVALTVNVYEDTDIDSVLIALSDTKATFFISEEFEFKNGDKVKKIDSCGHKIGLLEDNYKNKTVQEINDRLAARIESMAFLTGSNCDLVRFEGDSYDAVSLEAIYELGICPVQWSVADTCEKYSAGDIILITGESNIVEFIRKIKFDGYKTVTVDELIFNT